MSSQREIGLIILAAGESARLGAPKQLLPFQGDTLLRRIVRESLESICEPVVVVLGKDAGELRAHLGGLSVHIIRNDDWEQGMGASIKAGVEKLLEIDRQTGGAVLAVCDQPFVTGEIINRLAETFFQNQALIVASAYADTLGVPALFSRSLFPELAALKGRGGAKEIINRFSDKLVSIDFPEGATDIDTTEDFRRLEDGSN